MTIESHAQDNLASEEKWLGEAEGKERWWSNLRGRLLEEQKEAKGRAATDDDPGRLKRIEGEIKEVDFRLAFEKRQVEKCKLSVEARKQELVEAKKKQAAADEAEKAKSKS